MDQAEEISEAIRVIIGSLVGLLVAWRYVHGGLFTDRSTVITAIILLMVVGSYIGKYLPICLPFMAILISD